MSLVSMNIVSVLRQSRDVVPQVTPESPAAEAARLMASRRSGAVLVRDAGGRIHGVLSEAEIVRIVAERAAGIRGLAVEEVMRRGVPLLHPETPVDAVLRIMQQTGAQYLPVCSADGTLLGVVSMHDLAAWGLMPAGEVAEDLMH